MNIRVKMCGMTRIEDILAAAKLGVDAIGLIFYPNSPRAVTIQQAKNIVAATPPFITTVGVFVDASQLEIENTLKQVPLDLLQFHGHESPEACRLYHRPYIKAMSVTSETDLFKVCDLYADAKALLLDSRQSNVPGGTGQTFDWSLIPKNLNKPIILAGGLTPENVALAVQQVRPYAVDVTSGVEAAKGIKDLQRMTAFMQAVARVK